MSVSSTVTRKPKPVDVIVGVIVNVIVNVIVFKFCIQVKKFVCNIL